MTFSRSRAAAGRRNWRRFREKNRRGARFMAGLQASVRPQALQLCSDPSTLINHVNHLVYKSSPVHFYATLFYGGV